MIDLAYIQKKDGEFINDTAYSMWYGCRLLGIHTVSFTIDEIDSIEVTKGTLVHGWIGAVRRGLARLGIEDPHVSSAPEELLPYFGRKIWTTTLGEVRSGKRGMFIKPLKQHKLFNGHVMHGEIRDLIQTASYDDEVEVMASEVVNFETEYRCFINNKTVIGCKNYCGDFTKMIDIDIVLRCIDAYKSAPISYSLDMGLTDDGRTLPVEVNDAFALGSYGLSSVLYARMVEDRWIEMVGGYI